MCAKATLCYWLFKSKDSSFFTDVFTIQWSKGGIAYRILNLVPFNSKESIQQRNSLVLLVYLHEGSKLQHLFCNNFVSHFATPCFPDYTFACNCNCLAWMTFLVCSPSGTRLFLSSKAFDFFVLNVTF